MDRHCIRRVFFCAMFALAASCSAYTDFQESRPANVAKVEARLEDAGFHQISISTPEQNGAVAQLPLHRLNRYDSKQGSVFWYADPTVCKCLYQGDQDAYARYEGIVEQEKDTAEYLNDTRPYQVASLEAFGDSFPTPTMFGPMWPIFIIPPPGGVVQVGGGPGGGPIHVHGGPGSGGPHGIGGRGSGRR